MRQIISQESLDAYGWPAKTAVQSGKRFRKNSSTIEVFLTSLTIQKNMYQFREDQFPKSFTRFK